MQRLVFCFLCCVFASFLIFAPENVMAQGYDGLMANPDAKAPATETKKPAAKTRAKKAAPLNTRTSKPKTKLRGQQSKSPLALPRDTLKTADQLKREGAILKYLEDNQDTLKVNNADKNIDWSKAEYTRIDGLLPTEYMVKNSIEGYMKVIGDKKLPAEKRRAVARTAYKNLMQIADGLRVKNSMPSSYYRQAGLPESFINDSEQDGKSAMKMLNAAFDILRPLQ